MTTTTRTTWRLRLAMSRRKKTLTIPPCPRPHPNRPQDRRTTGSASISPAASATGKGPCRIDRFCRSRCSPTSCRAIRCTSATCGSFPRSTERSAAASEAAIGTMRPASTASSERASGMTVTGPAISTSSNWASAWRPTGRGWISARTSTFRSDKRRSNRRRTWLPVRPRFVGESLVYDQLNTYLAAMRGLDMEVGCLLPGQFRQRAWHPRLRRVVLLWRRLG